MILEIISYPDPLLRQKSKPVETITPEMRELASNMLETMYKSKGVGLAAPQVGKLLRLFVMDGALPEGQHDPKVFFNPQLEFIGQEIISEKEGCLSVPMDYRADVSRYSKVRIKAQDIDGNEIDEIFEGFPAIIIQHENDHLDGRLFIDKMSYLRRTIYDGKVKKWLKRKE